MTAATLARSRAAPAVLGFGTLIVGILAVEVLIRVGLINRFIVPLPSQIVLAFGRIIEEEDIAERFRLTFFEAFTAGVMITVVGVAIGILLYRVALLRQATETWVAALASAPTVLMYPLVPRHLRAKRVDHHHDGLRRRPAAGDPQDHRGPVGHAARAHQCRAQPQAHRACSFSRKSCFRRRCRRSSSGVRLGLIFTLINVVGVEFLINFGGLGQLINDLAERYDLPGTYAAICFVILVSICFFVLTERIERWLTPVE